MNLESEKPSVFQELAGPRPHLASHPLMTVPTEFQVFSPRWMAPAGPGTGSSPAHIPLNVSKGGAHYESLLHRRVAGRGAGRGAGAALPWLLPPVTPWKVGRAVAAGPSGKWGEVSIPAGPSVPGAWRPRVGSSVPGFPGARAPGPADTSGGVWRPWGRAGGWQHLPGVAEGCQGGCKVGQRGDRSAGSPGVGRGGGCLG